MRTNKLELLAVALVLSACSDPKFELGVNGGQGGGINESSGGSAGNSPITRGGRSGVGGATSASGGSSGASSLDQFTLLKLNASGGFTEPKPDDGECQPVDEQYEVDATTGEFSWRQCVWVTTTTRTTRYASGNYVLSADQLAELRQHVAGLTAPGNICGADKDSETLDLTVAGEVHLFADDFYACEPAEPGRSYIGNMTPLTSALRRFAMQAPLQDPQTVTLVRQGGFYAPVDASSECNPATFTNTYTLKIPDHAFTYSECSDSGGSAVKSSGERSVSDEEVQTVLTAVGQLVEGSDDVCGEDKPQLTLDIDTPTKLFQYADSFYSCQPIEGRTFVKNIDAVASAMYQLRP